MTVQKRGKGRWRKLAKKKQRHLDEIEERVVTSLSELTKLRLTRVLRFARLQKIAPKKLAEWKREAARKKARRRKRSKR